jgi:hypothetical protein
MHCDRECLLGAGGVCVYVFFRYGIVTVNILVMAASALVLGATIGLLLWASKKDPQWRSVLLQARKFHPPWRRVTRFSRTARWDVRE